MVEVRRLYLDTNVFVHWIEGVDERASLLMELIWRSKAYERPFFVTSELTLAELLVRPYRDKNDRLINAYQNLLVSSDILQVVPVGQDTLRFAAMFRAQDNDPKLPDAIHLVTAYASGCSHILTADQRLKGPYELTTHGADMALVPNSVEVLRPDIPTIQSLIEQLRP